MGTTTKWLLRWPAGTDVPAGHSQIQALAEDVENLMGPLVGTLAARPTAATAKSGRRYYATDTIQAFISDGANWQEVPLTPIGTTDIVDDAITAAKLGPAALKFEQGLSWAIAGDIIVPSGQLDVIPLAFVPVSATQVTKLLRVRYKIAAGTSATFKIQRNGSDVTGLTGLAAATTAAETAASPAVTLTDDDTLQPIVTSVSGSPQNLSITAILEHSNP